MFKKVYTKVGKGYSRDKLKYFATDEFTLDLACGNSPLKDYMPNRIGCDIIDGHGVDIIADAHDLPFEEGHFERVFCLEAIEHFHTPKKVIAEIARVLRPTGKLIMTVPLCYPVHEAPNDFQRYTEYGLRVLLEEHFTIDEITPIFSEMQTISILLQRIGFQKDMSRLTRWIICAVSHLLFAWDSGRFKLKGRPYQDIGKTRPGVFMTSSYLMIAERK
ncbi:MAG: class I SAM-dependent methyltransferase [Desulfovibrio sp.]|jgi:SAM-dependent methyltransferase|nr:class I SAM-dependent methyltransferase [Desulfovibrio sp.]